MPPDVVGLVGGLSAALVSVAVSVVEAKLLASRATTNIQTHSAEKSRSMTRPPCALSKVVELRRNVDPAKSCLVSTYPSHDWPSAPVFNRRQVAIARNK